MNIEATKRIYLDDGPTWNILRKRPFFEFYVDLRHGTQRAINAYVRPFAKAQDGQGTPKVVVNAEGHAKVEGGYTVELPVDTFDFDAVNDIIILGQVKSWSLGPINQATIDGLDEAVYGKIIEAVNMVFGNQGPLPESGGGN
ncbi:MAG: hypothetical protein WC329_01665 [Candidatus Omnitrophota bacterium]